MGYILHYLHHAAGREIRSGDANDLVYKEQEQESECAALGAHGLLEDAAEGESDDPGVEDRC